MRQFIESHGTDLWNAHACDDSNPCNYTHTRDDFDTSDERPGDHIWLRL